MDTVKMTRKIRKGVFETNSSSTHSICIAKNIKLEIPEHLEFTFGEFGWEHGRLASTSEKASYLYTGLIGNGRDADFSVILEVLKANGVKTIQVEKPVYEMHSYIDTDGKQKEFRSGENIGYVDHADELKEFLDDLCNDADKLLRFLFSNRSFILTGNDNDDSDVEIKVDYDYDGYYKGN